MYLVEYRIIEQLEFGTDIPEDVGRIIALHVPVDANETTLTIEMLDNYTVYEVNVSAVGVGVGPAATETERTNQTGECLSFPHQFSLEILFGDLCMILHLQHVCLNVTSAFEHFQLLLSSST